MYLFVDIPVVSSDKTVSEHLVLCSKATLSLLIETSKTKKFKKSTIILSQQIFIMVFQKISVKQTRFLHDIFDFSVLLL